MNTEELKKLLKGSTAVLILENGEPSFVILGYDSYKNLLSDQEQEKEVKINHPIRDFARDKVASPTDPEGAISNGTSQSNQKFQHRISEKESELLDKINKQILSLKDEIAKEEKTAETGIVDPALENRI